MAPRWSRRRGPPYGYFRGIFERYDARERNSTWRKARTLVARSQLVRDEDVQPRPFEPLCFDEYLERGAQIMAEHFPFEEAQRMLFRPLRNGRWFDRRLVWCSAGSCGANTTEPHDSLTWW